MVIEGGMKLIHNGHHSTQLGPFEQDSFDGGWNTKSIGKARDFNLMLGQGCKGRLETVFIRKGENNEAAVNMPGTGFGSSVDAFYCCAGEVSADINEKESYTLYEGELLLVSGIESDAQKGISFRCAGQGEAVIIRAAIQY
jgi:environmental stress-induced protein Ves